MPNWIEDPCFGKRPDSGPGSLFPGTQPTCCEHKQGKFLVCCWCGNKRKVPRVKIDPRYHGEFLKK